MEYTAIDEIKPNMIRDEFQRNNEYSCILSIMNRDAEIFLAHILRTILKEINQENLYLHLEYALNELSMNASKANSKRLYFNSLGLDINEPDEYEKGMVHFKDNVFRDFSKLKQDHLDNACYVKVKLVKDDSSLLVEVSNNSPFVQSELHRIKEKLKAARKFENLTEVLSYGYDSTEGGGFGLIIILLMLRKMNLDEKSLMFSNGKNGSITSMKIPLHHYSQDHSQIIADEIAKDIKQMPQFPESIVKLQRELSDPNCSFSSIADTVNSDPSLAAEIMRIANSPLYRVRNKINNVTAAVRLIGMAGVKSLLYYYGVNTVFNKRYDQKVIRDINDHSFRVALIASSLVRYKKLDRLWEDIYVAALLHDMGKIIVSALHCDLEPKLEKLCAEKHIPISILDNLTNGYNHSLIGSEVARKWEFPEKYINSIASHHNPQEVHDEYKVLTYAVYLSNEIYYFNKGERDFDDIDFMVLNFFAIDKKEVFKSFIDTLLEEGLGA